MKFRNLLIYHGFPLFALVFPFIWVAFAGDDHMLKTEAGIVENATVVFLVIAIGYCIAGLKTSRQHHLSRYLRAWLVLLILGATYFALEEISYGQHIFHWHTAEAWAKLNDQQETNLHNVSALFDQVPRALLTLAVLVGGVLYPLYRYFRGIKLDESNRFYWQWPTMDCVTVGLVVILIRPFFSVFETDIVNTGETKECFFGLFILLYCLSLYSRLRQKTVALAAPVAPPEE
jgi:hypothetical protein